jgi:hypothetical protein
MTETSSKNERHAEKSQRERRLRFRYAALTLALFVPLITAFAFVRNLYPFAASTMMMAGGDLGDAQTYYSLRGETASGEIIDLPPAKLTNALSQGSWSLVSATVENKIFTISAPHPANLQLIATAGGMDKLPPAARLNDLLRSWGAIYNSRLSPSSPQHIRAVTLQAFRWDGGSYGNYDRLVQTWRVEL